VHRGRIQVSVSPADRECDAGNRTQFWIRSSQVFIGSARFHAKTSPILHWFIFEFRCDTGNTLYSSSTWFIECDTRNMWHETPNGKRSATTTEIQAASRILSLLSVTREFTTVTAQVISLGSPDTISDKSEAVTGMPVFLCHDICLTMSKYPRLSFRLSPNLLRKVQSLALSRGRTKGQVIREAIECYFSMNVAREPYEAPESPFGYGWSEVSD